MELLGQITEMIGLACLVLGSLGVVLGALGLLRWAMFINACMARALSIRAAPVLFFWGCFCWPRIGRSRCALCLSVSFW